MQNEKAFTQSERTVGITFDHIFAEHQNTRIIIATFASNVDRVQQIINSACKYDRKVVVEGTQYGEYHSGSTGTRILECSGEHDDRD